MSDIAVDGGDVECKLAEVFGAECFDLELDDDVAAELEVVEEEVGEEFLPANGESVLLADVGESAAEFEQETGYLEMRASCSWRSLWFSRMVRKSKQ